MRASYQYFAGPNPGGRDKHEGNGRWDAKAPDPETALRAILSTVTFPGEMVGRHEGVFVDGISLPGKRSDEVIQLWSTDPAVIEATAAFGSRWIASNPPHSHLFAFPHTGEAWTCRYGLCREIAVEAVGEYLQKGIAVPLFGALPAPGDRLAVSPIGQLAGAVTLEKRQQLQLQIQGARIRQARSQIEVARSADAIREKVHALNGQLDVLNTYVHGMSGLEVFRHGERALPELPYHVMQSRLYLDQEIGLLVNLVDLDFRNLTAVDEWLEASGHWKKLLPFPKTILVTRTTTKRRDYGGWLENVIANEWNMANVVWIRDGDWVCRFNTDITFDDAIFRASDEDERVFRRLTELVFSRRFSSPTSVGSGKPPIPGLVKGASEAELPFNRERWETPFKSVEDWVADRSFGSKHEAELRKAAREYVSGRNMRRLPFLVLLQGMVDGGQILNIPPGTSLIDPVNMARYFRLVFDKDFALPDTSHRQEFERATAATAQGPGCWVIARVGRERAVSARFYQVVSAQEDGITVRYTPTARRFPYRPLAAKRKRKIRHFLPVSLPADMIARLLDDREWKLAHVWCVPVLALWPKILRRVKRGLENETSIDLGRGLDVVAVDSNGEDVT